jgi:hypothetical protein
MPETAANDYLEQGLRRDLAELDHVRKLISETVETLRQTCVRSRWPYVVSDGKKVKPKASASTSSMISFALAAASGIDLESPLAPRSKLLGDQTDAEDRRFLKRVARAVLKDASSGDLDSGTYGRNDPFTLGWLVPLLAALDIDWDRRDKILGERLDEAWNPKTGSERKLFDPKDGTALPHAFPLLRAVHLTESAADLKAGPPCSLPTELADEFATTVHRQLSNSEMADASFDPAELIFAFEGMLRSPGSEPSGALVDRFFSVVAGAQERSPSWRPLRPFIRKETGLVLLPLSIEGATSLARICRLLDRGDRDRRFGQLIEHFRASVQWLESQRVQITTVDGLKLKGWHSEHVREANTIYTWQTSQVLLFLLLYVELLEVHVAEHAVSASNLSIKRNPDRGPSRDTSASWNDVWTTFLEEDGGRGKQTANRSAVLYGPPGTGKTTLAEWLAAELGWSLISVTPSDFMAQGTAAVEARAQAVFTALLQQRDAVVIFDEIDRLILDRDRRDYLTSEGAFQLMTPSMLTKFNDLRKAGRVIFLAATNYRERIDRAIIRPGRFDEQLLIAPPGEEERAEHLKVRWKKRRGRVLDAESARRLGERTWFATYGELNHLVQDAKTPRALEVAVGKFVPAISLESYAPRMKKDEEKDEGVRTPYEEVLELAKLQRPDSMSAEEHDVVARAEEEKRREEERLRRRGASGGKP